ncbi:type IV secretory system conjugative DNA transfer family protein, partial [Burkholderia cepacia]
MTTRSHLNTPPAIVVGVWRGRYLRFAGQQFVLLAAPARSGKGVGVVIPNLLTFPGSVVALDIKQENYAATAGFRRAHGQDVYLFNPFAEDGRTHRYNPLSAISDGLFRVG